MTVNNNLSQKKKEAESTSLNFNTEEKMTVNNVTHKTKEDGSASNTERAKAATCVEDGCDERYNPKDHREQTHALRTTGALFHMVKGSLGSGILSMPVAFKNGGLWVSLVGTLFVGFVCTHCVHILVYCSQELCKRVKQPCLGYATTAEAAFATGPVRLRKYSIIMRELVDSALMITYYFGNAVYIVFIASSLEQVVEASANIDLSTRYYVLMLTVVVVPVGSIRELKYLVPFSFFAIIILLFGCGFVLYEVFADLPPLTSRPAFSSFQNLPLFYATVLFSLEGIGTVFPIENVMKNPEHFLGCPGVLNAAMTMLVAMYSIIGFFGYLRYGEATKGSITLNLNSSVIGQTVKIMVAVNVLFSLGLCMCVPAEILWRRLGPRIGKENKTAAYYTMRVLMNLGCVAVAFALPDLEPFVGLVGAICYSTLGLLFPAVIDLVTFWEDKEYNGPFHWKVYKNFFLVIMWFVALTAGTQASISKVIDMFF